MFGDTLLEGSREISEEVLNEPEYDDSKEWFEDGEDAVPRNGEIEEMKEIASKRKAIPTPKALQIPRMPDEIEVMEYGPKGEVYQWYADNADGIGGIPDRTKAKKYAIGKGTMMAHAMAEAFEESDRNRDVFYQSYTTERGGIVALEAQGIRETPSMISPHSGIDRFEDHIFRDYDGDEEILAIMLSSTLIPLYHERK